MRDEDETRRGPLNEEQAAMLSMRALECLVAIVEQRSLTQAAAVLYMSQPALWHQIAAIEQELGTPVIERLPRGISTQVITSGGQFPVSLAVHGNQVFVLNAWGGASVAGFLQVGGHLIAVPSWTRDLGLGTSSATVFTGTPGQIGFTPDGSQRVVTTKNAANTVDVFREGLSGPSAEPTVTSLPGTIPFGFTFDQYGHLALTETATNTVAAFAIAYDGTLTQLGSAATESTLRTKQDGTITQLSTTPTDPGTVDAAVSSDGQYLYVQAGRPGNVDAYRIGPDGSLTETGSVTVPGGAGGGGIVAS